MDILFLVSQVSCFYQKRKWGAYCKRVHACLLLSLTRYIAYIRFYNGGIFFSSMLLSAIACISLYSFLLLVQTRNKVPVSFGDIGGILFGKFMRVAVLTAITFSQVSCWDRKWGMGHVAQSGRGIIIIIKKTNQSMDMVF